MVQNEFSQFGQHNGFFGQFETVFPNILTPFSMIRALLKYIDAGLAMRDASPEQQQTTAHTKIGQDPR